MGLAPREERTASALPQGISNILCSRKCARACKMDVDVTKTPNHTECIRCGMCIRACPTNAVSFRYGFGDGKKEPVEPANTLKTEETK